MAQQAYGLWTATIRWDGGHVQAVPGGARGAVNGQGLGAPEVAALLLKRQPVRAILRPGYIAEIVAEMEAIEHGAA